MLFCLEMRSASPSAVNAATTQLYLANQKPPSEALRNRCFEPPPKPLENGSAPRGGILSRQCRTKSHTAHSRATRGELLFGLWSGYYKLRRYSYLNFAHILISISCVFSLKYSSSGTRAHDSSSDQKLILISPHSVLMYFCSSDSPQPSLS